MNVQAFRILRRHQRWMLSFVVPLVAAAASIKVHDLQNFDQVDGDLYRGDQPSPAALQELAKNGVKSIIDLRESGKATQAEAMLATKLGMKYTNIPFPAFSAPSDGDINQALTLLMAKNDSPIFLHCRRGKDRTGTVIACYRIQHDHWTNKKALAEAKEHGMSSTERGMQRYILHFNPGDHPGASLLAQ